VSSSTMPFVKEIKNKAYFKRYQVKFRRRREGKTDFRARKRLCAQAKDKYNQPKWRLVVRITNKFVITQITKPLIIGDEVMCSAYSSELPRYGLKVGLKNYSACYCTGLLIARRMLTKIGLAEIYTGQDEEVTGEIVKTEANGKTYYVDELNEDKRPFHCNLDVGIRSTTTGARIFGVMKGATDGGLDIPHNEKRFPGYDGETKKFEAEVLHDRIFGEHVNGYMEEMQEEDPELYKVFFAKYIECGHEPGSLEELYEGVHAAIREDPSAAAKKAYKSDKKYKRAGKKTLAQRKIDSSAKKAALNGEDESEEEEDDE
jgi:large subunit ribosomal protein L5e